MVKLVTVLSVSFPEDAGTGWQYVQMLVCVPLCARSEKRELVPSTGGWWPLTVCAFGSGGWTPHSTHTEREPQTALGPPACCLWLSNTADWCSVPPDGGLAGRVRAHRKRELGVWQRGSGAQASLASCLGAGAKMPSLWSLWGRCSLPEMPPTTRMLGSSWMQMTQREQSHQPE